MNVYMITAEYTYRYGKDPRNIAILAPIHVTKTGPIQLERANVT